MAGWRIYNISQKEHFHIVMEFYSMLNLCRQEGQLIDRHNRFLPK